MSFLPTKKRSRKSLHNNDLRRVRGETWNLVVQGETVREAINSRFGTVIAFVSLELPGNWPVSLRSPELSQVETISGHETEAVGRKPGAQCTQRGYLDCCAI